MGMPYYLAWICLIHLSLFSLVLLLKRSNQKANRLLAVFMLVFAYLHFTHLLLLTHAVNKYHFLNEVGFIFLFLQGPVYLSYTAEMTGTMINWKKYLWLHMLPFIAPVLFACSFFFRTTAEIKYYYDNLSSGQPTDAAIVLAIVTLQMGVYMVWSMKLVNRYTKKNRSDMYSDKLSLQWLKLLTIALLVITYVIGPALVTISRYDINSLYIYMPIITMIIYVILFIKAVNFPGTESEKNQVREELRTRISRDMHDDLGSGLSKISVMSGVLKQQLGDDKNVLADKISRTANDLADNMSQIIWSLNPENDHIDNLVAYIREYALNFFEDSAIVCEINFPELLPPLQLSQEVRRNVYLVIKETLNNTIKHADAGQVHIQLLLQDDGIAFSIRDNGIGFDMQKVRKFSNGLCNMQKRMEEIGGSYTIDSEQKKGTITSLFFPLHYKTL